MTDTNTLDLDLLTSPALDDALHIVDVSDDTFSDEGTDKHVLLSAIHDLIVPTKVLDKVTATASLLSSVVSTNETTLYTFTIPGGALIAGDVVKLSLWGNCQNNSGSGQSWTFKVKIGTTTIMTHASGSLSSGSTRRRWRIDLDINVRSATDYWGWYQGIFTNAVADGAVNTTGQLIEGTTGSVTESLAVDKAIELTNTFGSATSMDIHLNGGSLIRTRSIV